MSALIVIVHIVVCVALIMIVLLQTGKGADMGAAFGGGSSQTLFGSTGATTFLGKATTVAAVVFMLTSLSLAYMYGHRTSGSIMESAPAAVETPAPAPAETPAEGAQTPAPSGD
ncbi:MAG: preprotein translocase subunit SecG [Desulfobacterales bacterium]